ncbi:MAG: UDP-N-acetylmuramoyl-L-alanyl-D-glutamate--2,6-diaminopimelate ligase, partial [Pseudobdellovibrionaceae bacterium]
MQLQQLFFLWPEAKNHFTAESYVLGISQDSRKIKPGFVFVAVVGHKNDGHDHLEGAISNGALGLVVQDLNRVPQDYRGFVLKVPNTQSTLSFLATHFYGHPSQSLYCVGVTGTNGKTSTTLMIEWILNKNSMPCSVIGTIDRHFQGTHFETHLTTPDPLELQQNLAEFQKLGAKALAIEVSSHALDQNRVDGIAFDVAVFTNLTQDHLDYHKNLENYFLAKERLFREHLLRTLKPNPWAIVNVDDPYGRRIRLAERVQVLTYGERASDLRYEVLESDFAGTQFRVTYDDEKFEGRLPMIGRHNIANAVAALAVGVSLKFSIKDMIHSLTSFPGVPGRLQRASFPFQQAVFVDYAHTPDALFQLLSAIQLVRGKKKNIKIHTVFGCGGDRDSAKRPLMFDKANQMSDFVYVTSDNPRTED